MKAGDSVQVSDAVTELFRDSSVKVLEDEAVRTMAQQFVHGLLDEPHLQAFAILSKCPQPSCHFLAPLRLGG